MENIKVGLWGFGAMGRGMAKMLLTKKGLDLVAVCDLDPNKVGKSIFEMTKKIYNKKSKNKLKETKKNEDFLNILLPEDI